MRRIDLTGQKFNRLIVLELIGKKWRCKCECDNETFVTPDHLKSGHTRSCGCLLKEVTRKHGHAYDENGKQSKTYKAWVNMESRVAGYTESHRKHYTDRGITICARWQGNFKAFLEDMGECPPGLTLERMDNDGNYQPDNCEWATPAQQTFNRSATHKVTVGAKVMSLKHACAHYNIPYLTAMGRVRRGMTPQEAIDVALSKPSMKAEKRAAIAVGVSKYWASRT